MDEHFKVRRNVIFKRARFNRRCQKEGESIEQFITALYDLAEFCEYGTLKRRNDQRSIGCGHFGSGTVGEDANRLRIEPEKGKDHGATESISIGTVQGATATRQ